MYMYHSAHVHVYESMAVAMTTNGWDLPSDEGSKS